MFAIDAAALSLGPLSCIDRVQYPAFNGRLNSTVRYMIFQGTYGSVWTGGITMPAVVNPGQSIS